VGSIIFAPQTLADNLSETAGYKAGLALSLEELCDHLSGTDYPDLILKSESGMVRLRAEEHEALFYKLLHRIGYTAEEYDGDFTGAKRFHRYRKNKRELEVFQGMLEIFAATWDDVMDQALKSGAKSLDPTPFLAACMAKYGKLGLRMAMEQIEVVNRAVTLSPQSLGRAVEWENTLALKGLFEGSTDAPQVGRFLDQRFIDYLSNNTGRLPAMHWRKFEELSAEFFSREGFKVELGPGGNDDGVDLRIWDSDAPLGAKPLCLVQCKRQMAKVEKVIVKGLYADVQHEGAQYGVLVTTSALSPGARTTVKARGYPIREVDRDAVVRWLGALRTPGTGIVRV
jgi:restriction system protein